MGNNEVQGHWPGSCFGCSSGNPKGLQLRFSHTDEGCVTSCTIPDTYCGFEGLVHGGIIATLLDEAAGWSLFARIGRLGVTREMTTRYLKPVPTNTEIRVEGTIMSSDDRSAVVRSTIHSTDGTLLAEGESTWAFPRLGRIASLANVPEGALQQFLDDCCRK
ncbi:PaaI family thioesterase [Geomobilimonas luticola]|uniref:Acyl-coenzyme A thioesterase THEM4 n=1 Tax=Geomobilimonas luticola TaxID=1114878 RepID=A0ABS5SG87_9BACT|nr:PaaI family thioesterase [Geomobilimonas luticola]MBT0654379.1 PaaI family thioesterase [Geomobilimonas luticola]